MENTMPILLVPGLGGSPRIYAEVTPALWRFGPVTVANHIRDDNMGAIARRILAEAPPRFALAGHSMGGYIALEIMRQAPERVAKLALINTQARPDTPEASARRRGQILAETPAGLPVRLIETDITITPAGGTPRTEHCRLITTLADHTQAPAGDLAACYAQRWEIEMVFTQLAKGRCAPSGVIGRT